MLMLKLVTNKLNNMSTRAKFTLISKVASAEDANGDISASLSFEAVIDGSPENKEFWKWTPAGQINIHIDNPEALKMFDEGEEYYVDFTKAEKIVEITAD